MSILLSRDTRDAFFWPQAKKRRSSPVLVQRRVSGTAGGAVRGVARGGLAFKRRTLTYWKIEYQYLNVPITSFKKLETVPVQYRLFSFSGGTFLRGVQGNPNYFPILVQGDAVHGIVAN